MQSKCNFIIGVFLFCFLVSSIYAQQKTTEAPVPGEIRFYQLEKEYRKTFSRAIELKNAKVLEIKPIVEQALSIYGSVYVNEQKNTVFVTDVADKIDDLVDFVKKLDIPGMTAGEYFITRIVPLGHLKADEIIELVKHKLSKDGKIYLNLPLNALVITDIESKVVETEKLIRNLDVSIKQIAIEVAVVEVDLDYFKKLGLDPLGWLDTQVYGSYSRYEEREYYWIDTSVRFSDLISLMTSEGKGKTLATPRIVTQNNKKATLATVDKIFYTPKGSWYESVATPGVTISVLPTAQEDKFINLSITPVISNLTGWSQDGTPIVAERTLTTEVKVKDGDTFVLGGIRNRNKVRMVKGIPLLREIPLIKYLFSRTIESEIEREIVMFIKPSILVEGKSLPPEDKSLLEKTEEELKRK